MNPKRMKMILKKTSMRMIQISTLLSTSLRNQFKRPNIGSSLLTKISMTMMITATVMTMAKKMIEKECMRSWLLRWFGIILRITTSSAREKKTRSREIVKRENVSKRKVPSKKKRPELDLIKNKLRKSRPRKSARSKKMERKRRIRRRGRSTKKPTRLTKISM